MSEKYRSHLDLQPIVKASAQHRAGIHRKTLMRIFYSYALMVIALGGSGVFADAHVPTDEGDQADHQMNMPEASEEDAVPDAAPMKPMKMDHGNREMDPGDMPMDQGEMKMNMQGGSPPSGARDPHAYSGGLSIDSGEYSLPDVPRIKFTDEKTFIGVRMDNLEAVKTRGGSNGGAYDGMLRIGRFYNALVIKAEGEVANSELEDASTEVLYSHSVDTYWDAQAGVRYDTGVGPNRGWLALSMQGLAPYWFEIDATAYIGDQDRTAFRLSTEYELLITQRLVVQPSLEANFYGKDDIQRDIGSGLSDTTAGLRVRYEFSRQIAPYVGIEGVNSFGKSADLLRAAGESTRNTRYVAGLRFWF